MEFWTAFILGLAGSAHCAGMCGPLALALPRAAGATSWNHVAGRLFYNLGRVFTYGLLGLVFGLIGRSLALAGVQRWVSIGLGVTMLAGLLASRTWTFHLPGLMSLAPFRTLFGRLLRSHSLGALGVLGGLNGLLPCGLVYVACAAAAATGEVMTAIGYMIVFGLGTVPMMLTIALAGTAVQGPLRHKLQKAIPIGLACVAVLLILRGLSLGIPYVSPDLTGADGSPLQCH